jgi:hypothetical protein
MYNRSCWRTPAHRGLGELSGLKVGQLWLIDKQTLDSYLENAQQLTDQRFGPKWFIRELL